MLRAAAYTSRIASRRTFVSTVLLTRNWENESHNALKKEAKSRGLSQSGTKASLISRLQKLEQQQQFEAPTSVAPTQPVQPVQHQQVRHASTTELPGIPSSSKPSPLPPNYPKNFLDVKLPSGHHPVSERDPQVPLVPDLWDSSRIKAEFTPPDAPEGFTPKVVAVGGAATHLGGGPSHALYPESSDPESSTPSSRPQNANQGFWRDLADDLLIPTSFPKNEVPQVLLEGVAETTAISGRKSDVQYSRTLDKDERTGLWALLGLLAGSWVVAGFLQAPPAFAAATEPIVEVEEEVASKQ